MTVIRPPTLIGIALALAGPGIIALASARFADRSAALAVFLLLFVGFVATVAAIALRIEKLSGSEVGFAGLSRATPARAAILALFFILVFGPAASMVLASLKLASFEVGESQFARLPTWYFALAVVVVAAGEEWLYRGYAIERLQAAVGNMWIAAGISLLAFFLAHVPIWGLGVALTTLLSGGILTALYVRYRDVTFLMVAHILTDLYGLVVVLGHRLQRPQLPCVCCCYEGRPSYPAGQFTKPRASDVSSRNVEHAASSQLFESLEPGEDGSLWAAYEVHPAVLVRDAVSGFAG